MPKVGVATGAERLGTDHPQGRSLSVVTAASSIGAQKLGQPVPESNLAPDLNSGAAQHTQ